MLLAGFQHIVSYDWASKDTHDILRVEMFLKHLVHDTLDGIFPENITSNIGKMLLQSMTINKNLHYHNPIHICTLFEVAQDHELELTLDERIAILFHDAVYNPTSKENELNSVALMHIMLQGYSETTLNDFDCYVTMAGHHIMNTSLHLEDEIGPYNSERVMDLDMSGFSFDFDLFTKQSDAIKKEYLTVYTEEQYNDGRLKFLNTLQSKKYIYRTEMFKDLWEVKARNNIKESIKLLEKT